jgi:hypothetical protein
VREKQGELAAARELLVQLVELEPTGSLRARRVREHLARLG